jgi:hypothetical protein
MMFFVRLQGEDGKFRNYEMSVFDVSIIRPIDENNIDKGTEITTTRGFTYISNQPIDIIMLEKRKVESEYSTKILLAIASGKVETDGPEPKTTRRRTKRT